MMSRRMLRLEELEGGADGKLTGVPERLAPGIEACIGIDPRSSLGAVGLRLAPGFSLFRKDATPPRQRPSSNIRSCHPHRAPRHPPPVHHLLRISVDLRLMPSSPAPPVRGSVLPTSGTSTAVSPLRRRATLGLAAQLSLRKCVVDGKAGRAMVALCTPNSRENGRRARYEARCRSAGARMTEDGETRGLRAGRSSHPEEGVAWGVETARPELTAADNDRCLQLEDYR
ncbi:hypothetical protein B0H14DRAFT_3868907 [Mycena olivaceomarginata]|nr:hypothetical protein B0H14DRAFT_3868907 [Mycena olivaceomarginata]